MSESSSVSNFAEALRNRVMCEVPGCTYCNDTSNAADHIESLEAQLQEATSTLEAIREWAEAEPKLAEFTDRQEAIAVGFRAAKTQVASLLGEQKGYHCPACDNAGGGPQFAGAVHTDECIARSGEQKEGRDG